MSFGKDPENLGKVAPYGGNLGQRARHLTRTREESRKSSGGGAPYWKGCFKVPQGQGQERFGRLIPGEYVQNVSFDNSTTQQVTYEYVMFKEHYHGGARKGGICSSGPLFGNRQLRDPCHGCDIFWEDVTKNKGRPKNEREKKRISVRDMFAFNWWDYGLWYNAPDTDRDGKISTNDQGQPYMSWVMGTENDPRYQGCEWKYGHLCPWPMGETYKEQLLSANDYIMQDCANCSTRGSIQFMSKNCANCGGVVYDASSALTPEQREEVDTTPYQCRNPGCGYTGFLVEMINCGTCGNGKRASIFDVDLQVTAVGTKGQQTFLQIINRSEPRVIQVQDPEVLKTIGPLDLLKKFGPTPLAKQAELWGLVQAAPQASQQQPQQPPTMGPAGHMPAPVAQSVMAGQAVPPAGMGAPPPMQPPQMGAAPIVMGVPQGGMPTQAAPMQPPPQQPAVTMPAQQHAAPPPMQQPPQQPAAAPPMQQLVPQAPAPQQPPAAPQAAPVMPGAAPQPGVPQPAPGFAPPQQAPAQPAAAPTLPGAPGFPAVPYGSGK